MARGVKLYFLACCHVTSFSTRNFQPEHSGHKSLKKVQFVEVALFALVFVFFLQWSNPEQDCGMKKKFRNTFVLAFDVIMQQPVHTLFIAFFPLSAYSAKCVCGKIVDNKKTEYIC